MGGGATIPIRFSPLSQVSKLRNSQRAGACDVTFSPLGGAAIQWTGQARADRRNVVPSDEVALALIDGIPRADYLVRAVSDSTGCNTTEVAGGRIAPAPRFATSAMKIKRRAGN